MYQCLDDILPGQFIREGIVSQGVSRGVRRGEDSRLLWGSAGLGVTVQAGAAMLCVARLLRWGHSAQPGHHGPQLDQDCWDDDDHDSALRATSPGAATLQRRVCQWTVRSVLRRHRHSGGFSRPIEITNRRVQCRCLLAKFSGASIF
jgi:hypothetical protein